MYRGVQKMNDNTELQPQENSTELYVAKLGLIGSALSTFGDGLQTIASAIALREIKQPESTNDSSKQLKELQHQVNELTEKIARLEQATK